ncbi:unnamed protein product [Coregonus sp. 'balchen']|nr:unnamed protein product [Coregonus sp. 'balchen']
MLEALGRKVVEVYRSCAGDSEANLTTLQMPTNIEGRWRTLREEKGRVQKMQQEERLLIANTRKKLMPGSLPPGKEQLVNDDGDTDMEIEKQLYFFT